MSIFENTVMIQRKRTVGRKAAEYISLFFAILSLAGIVMLNPFLFLTPTIVLAALYYFVHKYGEQEFEYTYIEGEIDFDRISGKSRRKSIAKIDMEDLLLIAPEGSHELDSYLTNPSAVKKDCTSGYPDRKHYCLVYKNGNEIGIIAFEPDENFLSIIRQKNMRKVIL